jgi:hypothetical protein
MRVAVDFQDERLELELPEGHVVASWHGPAGNDPAGAAEIFRRALENPRDFPPVRQIVVPGDRVTIAFDPSTSGAGQLIKALGSTLRDAGVEAGELTILLPRGSSAFADKLPPGAQAVVHDPDDLGGIAYLATTKQGRRVYLSRHLTDADVVIPVGRLGYDAIIGKCGPWSVLYPGLSDHDTMKAHRGLFRDDMEDRRATGARSSVDDSAEVSWLLGSQFHVAVVPGSHGPVEVVAGGASAVREHGIASLERHWSFRAESRAELVLVGIGRPGIETTMESLAQGLATAVSLVQHGGKIVVLSRVRVEVGPALCRLIDAGDVKEGASVLRGHEGDEDFLLARRIAQAASWADVFFLSGLGRDLADQLSLVGLDDPDQARRLVAKSGSCTIVSQAELTYAIVSENGDH